MSSSDQKWKITAFSAALFVLFSSPLAYVLARKPCREQAVSRILACMLILTVLYSIVVRYSMDVDLF